MNRKLATIEVIQEIKEHSNADLLELAIIRGWQIVVQKNQFHPGDLCIFFEIDSVLPLENRYEFLRQYAYNKTLDAYRIRTAKLRGEISQGLAIPFHQFPELQKYSQNVGMDVSEILHIEKYEPPLHPSLQGMAKSFTWPISHTDEERLENIPPHIFETFQNSPYYISVKLDGTSSTFMYVKDEFHVCSRNLSIKESDENTYWKVAKRYDLQNVLRDTGLAIQGEIVGPGIQKNRLNRTGFDLYVFNVVDIKTNTRLSFTKMIAFLKEHNIPMVPVLSWGEFRFSQQDIKDYIQDLKYHTFFSAADKNQYAEGIVVRAMNQSWSFKYVNPNYLLKDTN